MGLLIQLHMTKPWKLPESFDHQTDVVEDMKIQMMKVIIFLREFQKSQS